MRQQKHHFPTCKLLVSGRYCCGICCFRAKGMWTMAYRAIHLSNDPIAYFLQQSDEGPHLRVSDVVLRANLNPKEIFSSLIRFATNSTWSHSALLYLLNDPP